MPTHLLAVFLVILLGFTGSALAVENNQNSEKRTNSPRLATEERQSATTTGDSDNTNEISEPKVGGDWANYHAKSDIARKRPSDKTRSRGDSSPGPPQNSEGGSETPSGSSRERQKGLNASTMRDQTIGLGASSSEQSRVLTARLKGSLCVSCLFHLERKIQALEGVRSAHIVRPAKVVDPVAEHPAHAQLQIIYNASKLSPKSIRSFIHRNDFDIKDEQDIELTADFKPLPNPNPLSDLLKNSGGVVNAQMKQPD